MKSYSKLLATVLCLFMTNIASAMLGPIPIYLNSEYRTSQNIVGSTSSAISFTKEEILSSGASNIGELLDSVPGINYESGQGNLTSMRIRGNEASHSLLIVDGSKITIGATQPNLDLIPLEIIDQVDVLKGPFSALYGPGALGGVIVIKTSMEQKDSNSLMTSIGSNNLYQVSLSSNNKLKKGNLNFALGIEHTDGINARTDDTSGEKDSIDKEFIKLGLNKQINLNTDINLNVLSVNNEIEYDKSWSGDVVKPDNNLDQINFNLKNQINSNFASELRLNHQRTQRQEAKYELNSVSLKNDYKFDDSLLSFGIEKESDKDIANNAYIKHTDLFGQYLTSYNDNNFTLGYRSVDHDQFNKHHTYNLGWSRLMESGIELNTKIGKSTNLPDHYANKLNIDNSATSLKPEHNKSIEFGIRINQLLITLFKNKTQDAFKWASSGYTNNPNGIENQGLELSHSSKFKNYGIDTYYTYLESIDTVTKLQQGRRPKHSFNIALTREYKGFDNKLEFIARSSTFDDDDNSTRGKNPGYSLINFRTLYQYDSDTDIQLKLNNLLDKEYTIAKTSDDHSYNQPGREFKISLINKF
ncbi:MAG: TonB-dependent receptor plug domain-containing protein [Gammaproteobacteria bacterium]